MSEDKRKPVPDCVYEEVVKPLMMQMARLSEHYRMNVVILTETEVPSADFYNQRTIFAMDEKNCSASMHCAKALAKKETMDELTRLVFPLLGRLENGDKVEQIMEDYFAERYKSIKMLDQCFPQNYDGPRQ